MVLEEVRANLLDVRKFGDYKLLPISCYLSEHVFLRKQWVSLRDRNMHSYAYDINIEDPRVPSVPRELFLEPSRQRLEAVPCIPSEECILEFQKIMLHLLVGWR